MVADPHSAWHRAPRKLKTVLHRVVGKDYLTGVNIDKSKKLTRIGSSYGGWYVPLELFDQDSIIYCGGCGEDISFDLELIEILNCEVYAFDPTPRAINYVRNITLKNDKYKFQSIGLWDKRDKIKFFAPTNDKHVSHSALNLQNTNTFFSASVDTIRNIMQRNDHQSLSLLKLDIEGAEYKVVNSLLGDKIFPAVICIEYDEFFNPLDKLYRDRIVESVRNILSNGYTMIYAEGNGNYTFLRKETLSCQAGS